MMLNVNEKMLAKVKELGHCLCDKDCQCPCTKMWKSLMDDGECYCGMVSVDEEVEDQLQWLYCLENAGVDNWSGIDYAKEEFNAES